MYGSHYVLHKFILVSYLVNGLALGVICLVPTGRKDREDKQGVVTRRNLLYDEGRREDGLNPRTIFHIVARRQSIRKFLLSGHLCAHDVQQRTSEIRCA